MKILGRRSLFFVSTLAAAAAGMVLSAEALGASASGGATGGARLSAAQALLPLISEKSIVEIVQQVGLVASQDEPSFRTIYQTQPSKREVRVAILDSGFLGWRELVQAGVLPRNTKYRKGPAPLVNGEGTDQHGAKLAELVARLLVKAQVPFEITLVEAGGLTNFRDAAKALQAHGEFEIALHAQTFEYGGNDDGGGPFNAALAPAATNPNLLWINAAGNFEQSVYRAVIQFGSDGWVKFPNARRGASFQCEAIRVDGSRNSSCHVRIVLTWNDFSDNPEAGTNKDLNLYLFNQSNTLIQSATSRQIVGGAGVTLGAGETFLPREIVEADVEPGSYSIQVHVAGGRFLPGKDSLRILVSGDNTVLDSGTQTLGESLFAPADNPNVVSIGASDDPESSVSERLGLPHMRFPSRVVLDVTGQVFIGSSNGSAVGTAVAAQEIYRNWGQPKSSHFARLKERARGFRQARLEQRDRRPQPSATRVSYSGTAGQADPFVDPVSERFQFLQGAHLPIGYTDGDFTRFLRSSGGAHTLRDDSGAGPILVVNPRYLTWTDFWKQVDAYFSAPYKQISGRRGYREAGDLRVYLLIDTSDSRGQASRREMIATRDRLDELQRLNWYVLAEIRIYDSSVLPPLQLR